MAIEILSDNPQGDLLDAAFELIRRELELGRRFTQEQKDVGIRLSIDALAPAERPWFFEVATMNRIGLWQTLWGQWRRCKEWGASGSPMLDPGWADNSTEKDYGIGERQCLECGVTFIPRWPGETFCSNACGVAEEKRKMEARNEAQRAELIRQRAAVRNPAQMPVSLVEEPPAVLSPDMIKAGLEGMLAPSAFFSDLADRIRKEPRPDDEKSLDLGTDFADTEK